MTATSSRNGSCRLVSTRRLYHKNEDHVDKSVNNLCGGTKIAAALECSTADLVGGAVPVSDRDTASAQAAVSQILQTLVEIDLADPATTQPRPLDEVAKDAALIWDLRLRCDYAGAGRLLPRVLRELHAHAAGDDRVRALSLLARTTDAASFVVRYTGHPAEAWLASDRARDAALAAESPVLMGLAAWSLGHSATGCGSFGRALRVAEAAIPALEQAYNSDGAPEMLGSLYMLAAFSLLGEGRRDDATGYAQEASRIAERTGDSAALGLNFGPTNINCWWISMEVDGGEPGRAVEIGNMTQPSVLTVSRQTSYFTDMGRALARLGRDQEAVRMLVAGERVAPQRVHSSSLIRATVRGLVSHGRDTYSQLRGLAERFGTVRHVRQWCVTAPIHATSFCRVVATGCGVL